MSTSGPISQLFTEDHRRLDDLLQRSLRSDGSIDSAVYAEFRAGLLRHIGMEEKVLFPAAKERLGRPIDAARQLRADHAALAALLVPPPTAEILRTIAEVLEPHNHLEEKPGGVYDTCEQLTGTDAEALLAKLRAFPPVKVAPHNDGERAHLNIARMLEARRSRRP